MWAMDARPEQRPEGKLIAAALKRSGLSQRQAAAKAGISENRWRAIMHGYQSVSAGVNAPVRGPAETVARMAKAVDVDPEQLEEVDRLDAADELRELLAIEPEETSETDPVKRAREKMREAQRLMQEAQQILGGDTAETDEPRRSAG